MILVARRKDRLEAVAAEITAEYAVRAETLGCDLSKPASRQRLPARVASLGLEVDVLVNNAGFATGGPFHLSDPERELDQVRVLVEAPVALSSAFIPGMVRRGSGAVLNVASTAGMQPLPYSAGYSAAKAYMLSFSEALHHELRGSGVTVTALAPGPVSTEFWETAGWEVGNGESPSSAPSRSPAWVTAEETAVAGVSGLDAGKRVVVPGLPVRAAMLASAYLPSRRQAAGDRVGDAAPLSAAGARRAAAERGGQSRLRMASISAFATRMKRSFADHHQPAERVPQLAIEADRRVAPVAGDPADLQRTPGDLDPVPATLEIFSAAQRRPAATGPGPAPRCQAPPGCAARSRGEQAAGLLEHDRELGQPRPPTAGWSRSACGPPPGRGRGRGRRPRRRCRRRPR